MWRDLLTFLGWAVRGGLRACLRKEGLACAALIASTGGAAVLTAMLFYSLRTLAAAGQWAAITNAAYGLLATVAMIIFSLGRLLAGKMSLEAELWKLKFKAANGEDC